MKTFKSKLEFQKEFSTYEKCREYLEKQRWNGTPACPFCGSINVCRFAKVRCLNVVRKSAEKSFL